MKYKNLKSYKILVVFAIIIVVGVISFLVVRASPDFKNDTFTDEAKILGAEKVEIATTTGQIKLAECYSPNPSWSKIADTIVRDISNLSNSNATTSKDIYCDGYNCVLWTDGAATPTSAVCIATDSNVYAKILWSKTDVVGGATNWGSSTAISGEEIGGTHDSSLKAGAENTIIGAKNWLNRYYWTGTNKFSAMDACRAKGSGWRLPTILELDSIRDQAKGSRPYSRLPGIAEDSYWSSSESSATIAFTLNFYAGYICNGPKIYNSYVCFGYTWFGAEVRCVRGQ